MPLPKFLELAWQAMLYALNIPTHNPCEWVILPNTTNVVIRNEPLRIEHAWPAWVRDLLNNANSGEEDWVVQQLQVPNTPLRLPYISYYDRIRIFCYMFDPNWRAEQLQILNNLANDDGFVRRNLLGEFNRVAD